VKQSKNYAHHEIVKRVAVLDENALADLGSVASMAVAVGAPEDGNHVVARDAHAEDAVGLKILRLRPEVLAPQLSTVEAAIPASADASSLFDPRAAYSCIHRHLPEKVRR
jgi:hypothetical protein